MSHVLDDFREFRKRDIPSGIERTFVLLILYVRQFSLSYRCRCSLPASDSDLRHERDSAIERYCLFQATILVLALIAASHCLLGSIIGAYCLFEIFLVLAHVLFVGKFDGLQAEPASIERTLLLLLLNALEVIVIFAIFYGYLLKSTPIDSFLQSALVFGTVGYPDKLTGFASLLIALQIVLDMILTLLLLGGFASRISVFSKLPADRG